MINKNNIQQPLMTSFNVGNKSYGVENQDSNYKGVLGEI